MEKIFEYLELLKEWVLIGTDYMKMLFTPEFMPYLLAAIGVAVVLLIWGIFNGATRIITSFVLYLAGFLVCFDAGFAVVDSGASGMMIFSVVPNIFWEISIGFAVIAYVIFYRVICGCTKKSKIPALLFKTLFVAAFIGATTAGVILLFMGFNWPYALFIILLVSFIMYLSERLWLM